MDGGALLATPLFLVSILSLPAGTWAGPGGWLFPIFTGHGAGVWRMGRLEAR